nr:glycerate kinase [Actinomycetospora corticicola]
MPAVGVAEAIARALTDHGHTVELCPIADGGDGTVDAAVAAGFERRALTAAGPTGEPVATSFARSGDTAVVELADVCGLVRLPGGVLEPYTSSTRGLGEVVRAALDAGAGRIVLGLGGSASTDGGAGLAQALGAVLRDADGRELPPGTGGGGLPAVVTAERPPRLGATIEVACDVDNPLLGEHGAAAVYGPQKGAGPDDVEALDAALAHWAEVVGPDLAEVPGAGAAGGAGFGLMSLLDARLRPGFDLVADLLGFDERLARADLVVTGEGRLDAQTLRGKGPAGVAARARAAGVEVLAVAGRVDLDAAELAAAGIVGTAALLDLEPDLDRAQAHAAELVTRAVDQLLRATR